MRKNLRYDYVISDLIEQQSRLLKIVGTEPKFDPIIRALIKWDSDKTLTTSKLAEITNLDRGFITKGLKWIYESGLKKDLAFKFFFPKPENKIIFCVDFFGKGYSFVFEGLSNIPRRGDQVDLTFYNEKWSGLTFYVSQIMHEINGIEQLIYLFLDVGEYNLAWEYEKGKAELSGKFKGEDYLKSDSELKKEWGFF